MHCSVGLILLTLFGTIKLISGMVGEVDASTTPPSYRLFTHKKLEIGYNGKQVSDTLFSVSLLFLYFFMPFFSHPALVH